MFEFISYTLSSCLINRSLDEQLPQQVQGQGEHVGVVILGSYGVQRLQIAELQRGRGLVHHISSLTQLPGGTLLTFSRDHLQGVWSDNEWEWVSGDNWSDLCLGLSVSFSLSSH